MKLVLKVVGTVPFVVLLVFGALFTAPRPADTTEARVFEADGAQLDYCEQPLLDGTGLSADEIPTAYSPGCGWDVFPMPILAQCTEPLAPGVTDLRGLWLGISGLPGHVERIEQCGDRIVITSGRIIHDMRADGTLQRGANDVGPGCLRIFAASSWVNGAHALRPFGGPVAAVTRRLDGDELVWVYPVVGTVRMTRICRVPGGS